MYKKFTVVWWVTHPRFCTYSSMQYHISLIQIVRNMKLPWYIVTYISRFKITSLSLITCINMLIYNISNVSIFAFYAIRFDVN